jgi:hypothetical protein
MSYTAEIEIFGIASDPEKMHEVYSQAAAEMALEPYGDLTEDNFVKMMEDAVQEGRALHFSRGRASDVFEDLTGACREAGLSYRVHYGDSRRDTPTDGFAWHPGLEDNREFLLRAGIVTLREDQIQAAEKNGVQMDELFEEMNALDVPGKLEFAPGFLEAFKAYDGPEYEIEDGEIEAPALAPARP